MQNADLLREMKMAGVPSGILEKRMAMFGKDFVAINKRMDEDVESFDAMIKAGRGFVIQGAPLRAMEATYTLLKALILIDLRVMCVRDFRSSWFDKMEVEDTEAFNDAQVLGFISMYDPSYKTFPYGDAERRAMEDWVTHRLTGECTPVFHSLGPFANQTWWSDNLFALISERCEFITIA